MLVQKYKYAFISMLLVVISMVSAKPAYGAITESCPDGYQVTLSDPSKYNEACKNHQSGQSNADDTESGQPNDVSGGGNFAADCDSKTGLNQGNCGIIAYLVTFINILSGIVGIVIVIMIAVGGIQYSAARDNPQATAAAKGRIVNAITALVIYLFSFAILQWLVPGGLF